MKKNDLQILKNKLENSEAFLFDMDGTIIDLEKLNFKSFENAVKKKLDQILTPEEYQLYFSGVGSEAGFRNYLKSKNLSQEFTFSLLKLYRGKKQFELANNFLNVVNMKKGVVEFLDSLKEKNKKVALATSTTKNFTFQILKKYDLVKYFHVILTIEDIKKGKPDPEIYNLAMQKLGTTANASIAFEDSLGGIKSAESAGIFTVGILTPGLNDDFIENSDAVIEDFETCTKLMN